MLAKSLCKSGFTPSKIDPCVFINDGKIGPEYNKEVGLRVQGKVIIFVYVNDCIIISDEMGYIRRFIKSLADDPEHFEFTEEGSLASYLGVKFLVFDNGNQFEMTQPFLTGRIIEVMDFEPRMTDA